MLGIAVHSVSEISARPQSPPDTTFAGEQAPRIDREKLDVYIANKQSVDQVWTAMSGDATLADAMTEWAARLDHHDHIDRPPTLTTLTVCENGSCRVAASGLRVHRVAYSNQSSHRGDRRFGFRVRAVARFVFCRRR